MGDGRIAGQCLCVVNGAVVGAADHRLFYSAMLIPQCDFQVEDLLPVTLETEMARLNDPGVYRADRHFVNLVAFDAEKVTHARLYGLIQRTAPSVTSGLAAKVSDGLEPGMADGL